MSKKNNMLFLPEDVIFFNILIRLRAEKVYKFRSVCKSWYKLIHDPLFIQSHLKNSTPGLIIKRRDETSLPITEFKEMKDRINTSQDLEFDITTKVIASCNGLVLLKTKSDYLCIANLITKRAVKIPSASATYPDGFIYISSFRCGFTYVPEIGIYKLVRILFDSDAHNPIIEVLTLGSSVSKTWRLVNEDSLLSLDEDGKWEFIFAPPVSINGIVYFNAAKWVKSSSVHIVSFDAGSEVIRMFPTPTNYFSSYDSLVELGGMVSFVQATNRPTLDTFNVWILKDWLKATWVKQHTISIMKPSIGDTLQRMNGSEGIRVLPSFSHGGRKILVSI